VLSDGAVVREPLAVEVTGRLRKLILNNDLVPGTHLVEATLAESLGVSRGPVREALKNLDREGLIVISPHKGAVVAEWSLQDLLDAYDVRILLELHSVELATERAAEACVKDLRTVLAQWEHAVRTEDRERCADLDFEFHRVIWRHSNNKALSSTLEQTIHPLQTVFYLNATRYDDLREVIDLHSRLCDAIASGDPVVARAAMDAHMNNSLLKARQHADRVLGS
jgi:DNA-binding GntR family transcriptional regulator